MVKASLQSICRCPSCRTSLEWEPATANCTSCGAKYPVVGGVPVLLANGQATPDLQGARHAAKGPKDLLPKRFWPLVERYRLYLRPDLTFKTPRSQHSVLGFASGFPADAIILNVGSGDTDFGPNVINLDVAPYRRVDVVGVAERLPLADSSCDGIILVAVLEHVQNANRTFQEIRRVLTPGGRVFVDVPFLQGYHAAPADHRRYTEQGLRAELELYGFEVEASGVAIGPASALTWIASEFLALLISFRSVRAYRLARLATSWLSWPLKFADLWLAEHPMAHTIASAVWATATLPDDSEPEVTETRRRSGEPEMDHIQTPPRSSG